ncbi:hypothetical protein LY76DRAFT_154349 [Colletotrichum caudatum]|nr:hypothetical protein LY76DRAFT_154349 [Colletotrichum caudatum]
MSDEVPRDGCPPLHLSWSVGRRRRVGEVRKVEGPGWREATNCGANGCDEGEDERALAWTGTRAMREVGACVLVVVVVVVVVVVLGAWKRKWKLTKWTRGGDDGNGKTDRLIDTLIRRLSRA